MISLARAVTRTLGGAAFLLAALATGCADHQFSVQYAPEFSRAGIRTVSVFGIFRDGRMSPDAWDLLGPRLSAPFGKGVCETAYTDRLVSSEPALSSAVDDFARANGVTDELLDQFVPMAEGDAILLVTVAGRPPQTTHEGTASTRPPPTMGSVSHHGGMRQVDRTTTDHNSFDLTAVLFSTRLHRSVAAVAMTYTGKSIDEAYARFATRLGTELQGTACTGWKADVHIDEQHIRDAMAR